MDQIISLERLSDRQAILHLVPTNFLPKILENITDAPLTLRFNFEDFPRSEIRLVCIKVATYQLVYMFP